MAWRLAAPILPQHGAPEHAEPKFAFLIHHSFPIAQTRPLKAKPISHNNTKEKSIMKRRIIANFSDAGCRSGPNLVSGEIGPHSRVNGQHVAFSTLASHDS